MEFEIIEHHEMLFGFFVRRFTDALGADVGLLRLVSVKHMALEAAESTQFAIISLVLVELIF